MLHFTGPGSPLLHPLLPAHQDAHLSCSTRSRRTIPSGHCWVDSAGQFPLDTAGWTHRSLLYASFIPGILPLIGLETWPVHLGAGEGCDVRACTMPHTHTHWCAQQQMDPQGHCWTKTPIYPQNSVQDHSHLQPDTNSKENTEQNRPLYLKLVI